MKALDWGLSTTENGITAPKTSDLQQQNCGKFFTCSDHKAVWVTKRIPPLILHLRTKCRSVVCFTPRATLPLGKKPPPPRFSLNGCLGGSQNRHGRFFRKSEKSMALAGKVTSPQPGLRTIQTALSRPIPCRCENLKP
jgi:hypothetical protein